MKKNSIKYYLNEEVYIVMSYPIFELVKIQYKNNLRQEIVDINLVKEEKTYQNMLSLNAFYGG